MGSDTISVWLLRLDKSAIDRNAALAQFGALLGDAARRRALSYIDERSSVLHIFGRALLQVMLRRHLPSDSDLIDAGRWEFITGYGGKPALAAPFDRSGLQFNLSHSGLFVMCAVTPTRQVGIDIESLSREVGFDEIAARHFAARETAEIRRSSGQTKRERFFYYWTLKEAYLKARGAGIAYGLDDVSFVPQRNGAVLLRDTRDDAADDAWGFNFLDGLPGCVAALCWQRQSICCSPYLELRIIDRKELAALACAR